MITKCDIINFPFLFSEELKLQRNLENYALLSKGGTQARSSQQQSQQNFNDRRDFTITKVYFKGLESPGFLYNLSEVFHR